MMADSEADRCSNAAQIGITETSQPYRPKPILYVSGVIVYLA